MGLATAAGLHGRSPLRAAGRCSSPSTGPRPRSLLLSCTLLLVPLLARALTGPAARTPDEPGDQLTPQPRGAAPPRPTHPSYLLLTSGFFVCGFHIAFITTHLPPYLTDQRDAPVGLAAWSVSLIGLFNVIGAYTSGILGGSHPRRLLLSGIYSGPRRSPSRCSCSCPRRP